MKEYKNLLDQPRLQVYKEPTISVTLEHYAKLQDKYDNLINRHFDLLESIAKEKGFK